MRMNRKLIALMLLSGITSLAAMAQVSPYGWRGPQHNGNYPDTGLLKQWPAEGPQLVFETEDAGKGYSSPVVVGDRVYLTGMNEDETSEVLHCYNLKGEKQYTVEYGKPWTKSYPDTRTTPAIADGKAYVISGMGEVVCIDCKEGKILWTVDGGTKYGRKTGAWGTSECPLVYDDKVIYTPCGDQTTIVALNKETGQEMWKSRSLNNTSGYVSPIMIEYKGKRQIVGSTATNAFGVNPDNGEIEWTFDDWGPKHYDGQTRDNIAPNSALYHDGKLFFCHGYNVNGFQLKLADDLKSVTCTWRTETLDTHHGGYVLVDGKIYGSNWINNNDGNWCCLDWETGQTKYEEKWQGGGAGKGSIISADGKLYAFDERRGNVALVNATSDKFDIVSQFRVAKGSGPYWAHLHISDGILYLRHGEYFAAYKLK